MAVFIFLFLAGPKVDPANWTPFMPFGISGVVTGAATIFLAYIGFDIVSTAAEEFFRHGPRWHAACRHL